MKVKSMLIVLLCTASAFEASSQDIDYNRLRELEKKYNVRHERPKSCPLESKNLSELVAKAESIKDILTGNCAKDDNGKFKELMDSFKELKEEIKTKTDATSESSNEIIDMFTGSSSNAEMSALAGQKFSSAFSSLSGMLKSGQCKSDSRMLEMTANVILDSTQIGILTGNPLGLAIAGGGFLAASTLKLIDQLLKQKFDFEKSTDRQSFIKLNCSFYEIRRDLEISGVLDLENSNTKDDYRDAKDLVQKITAEIQDKDKKIIEFQKENSTYDQDVIKATYGDITSIKKSLTDLNAVLKEGIKEVGDLPSETQKLLMISRLSQKYEEIKKVLDLVEKLKISSMPMLDTLFLQEMKKFDYLNFETFEKTMELNAKDFNDLHRAKLMFHISRLSDDIATKEKTLLAQNQNSKNSAILVLEKEKEDLRNKLTEIKKVEMRLGNLINPKQYTGLDDGSENLISIVDHHQKISSLLYGEWGYKFLKYATEKSAEGANDFNSRYKLFNKKYGNDILSKKPINLTTNYLCQDAQKLRLIYRHAQGLTQQGYDFVATNRDIFYSDLKNRYNMRLNEEGKSNLFLAYEEKIQRHYMSAIYATKQINGEAISHEIQDKYLSRKYIKTYYLGYSIVEVNNIKEMSKTIQDVFDDLQCQKSFGSDLSL